MPWANYHSHTYFCDGKYPPGHYAAEARRQGFAAYGFSSHAPLPFPCQWSMKPDALPRYMAEVQKAKQRYQGELQLYAGLEIDYIAGVTGPRNPLFQDIGLDYCVGSVHFVGRFADGTGWEIDGPHELFLRGLREIHGNNIRRAVEVYYEQIRRMIAEEPPDVVGHLDKIKMQNRHTPLFDENGDWYQAAVLETLQAVAKAGLILEVNTRGLYKKRADETYPGHWALAQAHRLGIPVTLSSDAHHPREISGFFAQTAQMLREIGYQNVHVLLDGTWQAVSV
jgi:histidinol-phosphatase (PHP family)